MKRMVIITAGASTLLFSHIVLARAGWTDFVAVAELVPTSRHYYEVRLPVKENPSGCKSETWFYQNYDSVGSDKMFNTLLEGLSLEIQLRVYVTGICNTNGYSEFSSVSIVP